MRLRGEYEVKTDKDRLQVIADLIEEGSQDGYIRSLALNILDSYGVKEKDEMGEVRAIFDWVKKNIKYRKDVLHRDSYQTAKRTVEVGAADCDCMVILLNSLLASIGYPVGARIITTDPNRGFHHIYALVGLPSYSPKRWIPLDATNKAYRVGDEPYWVRKKDFVFSFE